MADLEPIILDKGRREVEDVLRRIQPDGTIKDQSETMVTLQITVTAKEAAAAGQSVEVETPTASEQTAQRPARKKIPEAVKRAVFRKAEGRCRHVMSDGSLCGATAI